MVFLFIRFQPVQDQFNAENNIEAGNTILSLDIKHKYKIRILKDVELSFSRKKNMKKGAQASKSFKKGKKTRTMTEKQVRVSYGIKLRSGKILSPEIESSPRMLAFRYPVISNSDQDIYADYPKLKEYLSEYDYVKGGDNTSNFCNYCILQITSDYFLKLSVEWRLEFYKVLFK